jgi:hypothetical protein
MIGSFMAIPILRALHLGFGPRSKEKRGQTEGRIRASMAWSLLFERRNLNQLWWMLNVVLFHRYKGKLVHRSQFILS